MKNLENWVRHFDDVILSLTVVVIGFQTTQHTVNVLSNDIAVSVLVLSGELSRDVSVTFETFDSSAIGE